MWNWIKNYTHWLHGRWPAGVPEPMPQINPDGSTALPGAYVVGDLTGVPLLKFSADTGAKAVSAIVSDKDFSAGKQDHDLVIIGGGVSGYAAALEAKQQGLNFVLLESSEPFSTVKNFPKGKPIYTYPTEMEPEGELTFADNAEVDTREKLLSHLQEKAKAADIPQQSAHVEHVRKTSSGLEVVLEEGDSLKAQRVIIAIGRSGNFRKLDVPGFEKDKVSNRLHDPKAFKDQDLMVIGGGDSALEAAIACAEAGAKVSLSYRKKSFSRPKPENQDKLQQLADSGKVDLLMESEVTAIDDNSVSLKTTDGDKTIDNDAVLAMLGREAPLDFFRKSGIPITGESTVKGWVAFAAFFAFIVALYDWKNYGFFNAIWGLTEFPNTMPSWFASLGAWWDSQVNNRASLIGTLAVSMKSRSFYFTLLYTSAIGYFGYLRIKRRKTPYVKLQTWTLFLIQLFPLFLLPEIALPWLGYMGAFDAGMGKAIADSLFPSYIPMEQLLAHEWPEWGHPRAYWHAYGFILAWPLNVYNVFTPTPVMGWLIIGAIQTFVIIPWLVWKWGKGAYCGWICSCGGLAETMGDQQRHKMPHGPFWNKLNMVGQVILAVAFVLLFVRIGGWIWPESWANQTFNLLLNGNASDGSLVNPLSWKWTVDVLIGGFLGVGLYFKFSGRTWCRFACPLAALMHIYARFSRFRIFADKNKCISCNACTSVCHQGIDVMNFANKGEAMNDPQCVRCSACVQTCPTGVLSFGEIDPRTGKAKRLDKLAASPVQMAETIEIRNVS